MITRLIILVVQAILVAHWLHSDQMIQKYRELVALLEERIQLYSDGQE